MRRCLCPAVVIKAATDPGGSNGGSSQADSRGRPGAFTSRMLPRDHSLKTGIAQDSRNSYYVPKIDISLEAQALPDVVSQ